MPLPVILMYHSVDDRCGRSDMWGLSVAPANFASQIEALVSERTIVPLEDLARCVRAGRVPRGLAAITFDDGYANNATTAKPILERHSAPATLFYVTAAAKTPGFWWDRLERIVTQAPSLPGMLSIQLVKRTMEIPVEGVDRTEALLRIWSRVRELDTDDRECAIASMADMLAVEPHDLALRPLTIDEVEQLHGETFSIGVHTHTHPSLPQLGPVELAREIADSQAICEHLLQRKVPAFAYPFGDYDERVRAAVAQAGLTIACTTVDRSVRPDDDCLALPRVAVGNWSGDQLIRRLRRGEDS
jgi:peptidoglycan/xylan/chitin deacetylase (PgdA/CDA1 family)